VLRAGVDIGGTFTDLCVVDPDHRGAGGQTQNTPKHPGQGGETRRAQNHAPRVRLCELGLAPLRG
jgi:N-methylhydantoinase A/oxoprolinase/acetone carboxylase beta subunit